MHTIHCAWKKTTTVCKLKPLFWLSFVLSRNRTANCSYRVAKEHFYGWRKICRIEKLPFALIKWDESWAHRHFNSWNAEVSWERRKMAGVFINCIEITDSWSHWQVINKSSHRVSTVLSSRIDEKLRNYLIISQPMDLLRVKASRKINKPYWIGLDWEKLDFKV